MPSIHDSTPTPDRVVCRNTVVSSATSHFIVGGAFGLSLDIQPDGIHAEVTNFEDDVVGEALFTSDLVVSPFEGVVLRDVDGRPFGGAGLTFELSDLGRMVVITRDGIVADV